MSVVGCRLSVVGCELSVVDSASCWMRWEICLFLLVELMMSVVGCRLSVVGFRLWVVGCHRLYFNLREHSLFSKSPSPFSLFVIGYRLATIR
jgi:hypothetical protein